MTNSVLLAFKEILLFQDFGFDKFVMKNITLPYSFDYSWSDPGFQFNVKLTFDKPDCG